MESGVPNRRHDRRKGPDLSFRWVRCSVVLVWFCMVSVFVLVDYAQPDFLVSEKTWNTELLLYIKYLLIVNVVLALVGLELNAKRHRRSTDYYRLSFFIALMFSLIGFIFLLF